MYEVLTPSGSKTIKAAKIRAGDILKIKIGEFFPADLVLLRSSAPDGVCFIETANLDGETNLKLKKAPAVTQSFEEGALPRVKDEIDESLPNNDLYGERESAFCVALPTRANVLFVSLQ